jgi:Rrf2 family transcriptional regulator, cysteine metabolism repressor
MLKLSKKVEYGLISLMHMDSVHNGELATARELSDLYNIPAELLGKVLQSLAKSQLIVSAQGAKGGYRLSRELDRVTLGEVVEAVEGPMHIAVCQDDPSCCEQYSTCNIKRPVFQVQKQLMNYMYGLPLSEFRNSVPVKRPTAAGA